MKSMLSLWQVVAQECAARCRTSTTRDFETVTRRFEDEGESFLTIALPRLCKDFEKSLDAGKVDRNLFQGFTWKGGLPRFLGGFLDLVFDRGTGRLLDSPSIDAIQAYRQLTLMFGKVLHETSEARVKATIDGFIECEKEVRHHDNERTEADNLEFTRMSRLLWSDVLTDLDRRVWTGAIVPKHGPGATADRLTGNRKFDLTEWPRRLEEVFPVGEYLVPSPRFFEHLDRVELLEPRDERPVKVTPVPKDAKGPRLIAIEPTAMQYMQQALGRTLVKLLESGDYRFGWLVGFRDQVPNQELAREGSITGSLATLDLSEASDRVSNQLVRRLLTPFPWLYAGVDACRSRKADVPGHGVIRLAKFASMGSALTFPIEAIVFATVIMIGIERALNRQLTPKDIDALRDQVRVYGDDMIVPVEFVHSVTETLRTFGFKVNLGKSFWTGKFRESCGKEYYDGEDVTVVRVRRDIPNTRRSNALGVISTVSLRNRFYLHGFWSTARYLDSTIEELLTFKGKVFYPTVKPGAAVLGRWTLLDYEVQKLHPWYFSPLVRGFRIRTRKPESHLEGFGALMKVFLSTASESELEDLEFGNALTVVRREMRDMSEFTSISRRMKEDNILRMLTGDEPVIDIEHLERYGRPDAVDIKLGMAPPY